MEPFFCISRYVVCLFYSDNEAGRLVRYRSPYQQSTLIEIISRSVVLDGRNVCLLSAPVNLAAMTLEHATGLLHKQSTAMAISSVCAGVPRFYIADALAPISHLQTCQSPSYPRLSANDPLTYLPHASQTPNIPPNMATPASRTIPSHSYFCNRNPKFYLLPLPPQRRHRSLHHLHPLRPRPRLPSPLLPPEMAANHRCKPRRKESNDNYLRRGK